MNLGWKDEVLEDLHLLDLLGSRLLEIWVGIDKDHEDLHRVLGFMAEFRVPSSGVRRLSGLGLNEKKRD